MNVTPDVKEEDIAIELFRQDVISLARAAELAGLGYWSFRALLQSRDIPIIVEVPDTGSMDACISEYTRHTA